MESLTDKCKRCGEGRLRSWQELSEDEQEVVRRLPANRDYKAEERRARHRWCALCWHEEKRQISAEG